MPIVIVRRLIVCARVVLAVLSLFPYTIRFFFRSRSKQGHRLLMQQSCPLEHLQLRLKWETSIEDRLFNIKQLVNKLSFYCEIVFIKHELFDHRTSNDDVHGDDDGHDGGRVRDDDRDARDDGDHGGDRGDGHDAHGDDGHGVRDDHDDGRGGHGDDVLLL
ncbi:hypothetical protein AVEN_174108-1 [Araneus ventricosus]|uniref:Uncharacterized protein n=1 Tax=Araneus ventricosus TaxID=182803 RepID=A0A4Y2C2J5_ARAVE|nr:hypothetical protein AVEN_174108-1 [Araneus ventricosus]